MSGEKGVTMALSREQKETIVAEVVELLRTAKLTAIAQYNGLSVKDMQVLRRQATEHGTTIRVIKNRLARLAVSQVDNLQAADLTAYSGQLVYAFSSEDEVAPAQVLAQFAKNHPALKTLGGLNADGNLVSPEDMQVLASLPSKDQLRGQLVGTLSAPLSGFMSVLSGNLRGVLTVLSARADSLQ